MRMFKNLPKGLVEAFYINALLRESLGIQGMYEDLKEEQNTRLDPRLEWLKRCVLVNREYHREVEKIWNFLTFDVQDVEKVVTSESYRKAEQF